MPAPKDAATGDSVLATHLVVELEGKISGFFMSVSGMGSETAVIDHKVVAKGFTPINRKIPGRLSWGDITLKRGLTTNLDFWEWRNVVTTGKVADARKDGSIIMYGQDGEEVARWNFEKAWPVKVSGPEISSDSSEVAVEEIVLAHEFIERVK